MNSSLLSIHPDLTPGFLVLFLLVAMLLGMAKAGLSGLGLAIIPVMALIFGAKESTGVILPMLIAADIMAVTYWHRHAVWKHIVKILPWVAAGIGIALFVGNSINDNQFRIVMLSVVWIMLILMVVNDLWKRESETIPHNMIFGSFMGLAGGFATMIGLYLIMNTGKLPLQAIVWKNISLVSLIPGLISIPFIALGIYLGIRIVNLFSESVYRYFVIITTLVSSVLLFL